MKAKSGVGPKEYIKQLNDSFVKAQSASGVEAVTGATHSSESFQNYAQQLIQAAQAGNTDTIENRQWGNIERWYVLIERKNDSRRLPHNILNDCERW